MWQSIILVTDLECVYMTENTLYKYDISNLTSEIEIRRQSVESQERMQKPANCINYMN